MLAPVGALKQPNPYIFNNQGLGGQEEIAGEVVLLAYVPQAAL